MVFINLHLEAFDKNSFVNMKKLIEKGSVAISFAPAHISRMKNYQIEYFKDLFSNPNYILGQQGLEHHCRKCVKYNKSQNEIKVDAAHENYCFWFGEISQKEQEKFMRKGRKVLKKLFGKEPDLYVSPNHLFGQNTIKVVKKLKYKWMVDRAIIPIKPYSQKGIVIIPESKLSVKGSNQIYLHGNEKKNEIKIILNKKFEKLHELKPFKKDLEKIRLNRKLKIMVKIERDLINGFKVKKNMAQKISELIYGNEFVNLSIY